MSRGGAVRRTRTVSTRLTPAEWDQWERRRKASGRKEMGAWVRAVVAQAEGLPVPPDHRMGPVVMVPEVNKDVHRQLAGAAANLNQIAIKLNLGEKAAPTLAAVIAELRAAAMAVQGKPVSTR